MDISFHGHSNTTDNLIFTITVNLVNGTKVEFKVNLVIALVVMNDTDSYNVYSQGDLYGT